MTALFLLQTTATENSGYDGRHSVFWNTWKNVGIRRDHHFIEISFLQAWCHSCR